MKEVTKLNGGLLYIAAANTFIGLFIVENFVFRSISFLLAAICIGLIPPKKVWNYIIITLAVTVTIIYITNHLINNKTVCI